MERTLRLEIEDITDAQREAALSAARKVFEEARVTLEEGFDGRFTREVWDEFGFPEDAKPSARVMHAADVCAAAEKAAIQALGAKEPPYCGSLTFYDEVAFNAMADRLRKVAAES